LNTTLGKFHHFEGNDILAKKFLTTAIGQTNFDEEKRFIQKMIAAT
jgi:hypothetical protein